jgi:hypothetical protein
LVYWIQYRRGWRWFNRFMHTVTRRKLSQCLYAFFVHCYARHEVEDTNNKTESGPIVESDLDFLNSDLE